MPHGHDDKMLAAARYTPLAALIDDARADRKR